MPDAKSVKKIRFKYESYFEFSIDIEFDKWYFAFELRLFF